MAKPRTKQLVVCIDGDGYPASLEKRRIYVALPDTSAEQHGLLRIIDESGDDYVYPARLFQRLALSGEVQRALRLAS